MEGMEGIAVRVVALIMRVNELVGGASEEALKGRCGSVWLLSKISVIFLQN